MWQTDFSFAFQNGYIQTLVVSNGNIRDEMALLSRMAVENEDFSIVSFQSNQHWYSNVCFQNSLSLRNTTHILSTKTIITSNVFLGFLLKGRRFLKVKQKYRRVNLFLRVVINNNLMSLKRHRHAKVWEVGFIKQHLLFYVPWVVWEVFLHSETETKT